jgi:hypothetical protein
VRGAFDFNFFFFFFFVLFFYFFIFWFFIHDIIGFILVQDTNIPD